MNSFILRERDRHLPTLYIPKKGLASLRHKMVLGKQIERMRVTKSFLSASLEDKNLMSLYESSLSSQQLCHYWKIADNLLISLLTLQLL